MSSSPKTPPPPTGPSTQTPLLDLQQFPVVDIDSRLNQSIQTLETFLSFVGFHQSSLLSTSLSWVAFAVLGVLLPAALILLPSCSASNCMQYQISEFELYILVSQACLGAVSLFCISNNLRKRGLRRFLFVDQHHCHLVKFHKDYVDKFQDFYHLLVWCGSPCLFFKIALEVVRDIHMFDSWWKSIAIMVASAISWTYLITLFLSACLLFNLVCNLQVIHFDDYMRLLESDSDVLALVKEHMRLKHYLSKISHRFRSYLLLAFLLMSASQFMSLFYTTEDHEFINVINGGDFAVSSITELVGILVCLHAAAKFSRRAQGVASVASRWNALVTCSYTNTCQIGLSNSEINLEANVSTFPSFYESDLESLEPTVFPSDTQMSSYHKRQALVMYLQSNLGGVTVYGWTIDRILMNTIFFVEMSLVTFVLGKTIVFTSK